MKVAILAFLLTQAVSANSTIKLDYACRLACSQSKMQQSSYGAFNHKSQTQIYHDFEDITRKQFDDMMTSKSLSKLCVNKLGEGYTYESHDCDVFKH
jgi:hypothetical protein